MIKKFEELFEGVPGTPFGLQVGDYFTVTGDMLLKGRVMSRDDSPGNKWRSVKVSSNGKRTFTNTPYTSGLNTELLSEIGEKPAFILKATKVHPTYVEGLIKYGNGLMNVSYQMRVAAPWMEKSDEDLIEIFNKYSRSLTHNVGEQRFILGDEPFLLDAEGNSMKDVVPGVYMFYTYNFELSQKFGVPILYCVPSAAEAEEKVHKNFQISILDFMKLPKKPSEGEADVVAKWFSKKIGADVQFKSNSGEFIIPWFKVQADKGDHPDGYIVSPFFTYEKAEQHIQDIRKREAKGEIFPFNTSKLTIVQSYDSNSYKFTFIKLMDYVKLLGLDTSLRKLFHDKRGAISTKEFGI